ncbi:MAG: hypothetical protein N2110_02355 [Flavobacteriales bacterium]|nr:hypothetical protein [Flavobacteriales bacterium]MCX7767850.1 hypothetical protein [Flavobacteriales bacterium]MDW8410652.1 hypothetical protein [Flavobacteriales bacterium]
MNNPDKRRSFQRFRRRHPLKIVVAARWVLWLSVSLAILYWLKTGETS